MSVTHLLPPFGAERPLCRSPREKQPRPSLPSGSPRLQRLLANALHNSCHILIDVLEVRLVPIPLPPPSAFLTARDLCSVAESIRPAHGNLKTSVHTAAPCCALLAVQCTARTGY